MNDGSATATVVNEALFRELFDLKAALYASALMGSIVWLVNFGHGAFSATTAGLKQACYTFFMGGLISQLCRYLAARPWKPVFSVSAGILIPALIATASTYFVHSLKGTPEPVLSTLPVMVISIPVFALWSWKLRQQQ